jgi:phenylalanyl-tRNA synthetase beta chain
MPVIGIPVAELLRCARRDIPRDDLLRVLGEIGCDVDGFEVLGRVRCTSCGFIVELVGKEEAPPRCERCDADLRSPAALDRLPDLEVVRMELLAVRPDLFDPGGLGRALRGVLGIEVGLLEYPVAPAALRLRVDASVRREQSLRPWIAAAVLESVTLGEDRLKIIMKMQENLHWALGRNRKHASIGVYDLDSLGLDSPGPVSSEPDSRGPDSLQSASRGPGDRCDLEYTTEDPDRCAFVPLGAPGTGEEHRLTLRAILEEHPKGKAFAHLLGGFDRYPILRTVPNGGTAPYGGTPGRVLSMPPIINSEETKVTPKSRRLFIDVTGTGRRIVHRTLNILASSLLELDPGARLSAVRVQFPDVEEVTPDFTPQEASLDLAAAARLLGIPLGASQARDLLRRMGHAVGEAKGEIAAGRLRVQVPAWRNDILHERDLVEDLAIAHGYGNFPRRLTPTQTVGKPREAEQRADRLGDVLAGLGFTEIVGLFLTCHEQSDRVLGLPAHPATVLLENPISVEQTQLRTSLLPGILHTFARNRSNPLPQQVFEVGDVTFADSAAETGALDLRHAALGLIGPKAGFADIRALVEAVVRECSRPLRLRAHEAPFLLEGRGALLLGEDARGREVAWGLLGEVHPRVLESLGLQNPVVIAELTVPGPHGSVAYRSLG